MSKKEELTPEEITRQAFKQIQSAKPGQVVDPMPGWHYVVLPHDMDPGKRADKNQELARLGYVHDPDAIVVGIPRADVWRCTEGQYKIVMEFREQNLKARRAR